MNNTITLTDEQMKALQSGQSITIEPPKPVIAKWEPKGGNYSIGLNFSILNYLSTPKTKEVGLEYQTQFQAEQAAKALRSYARQLAWLAENDDLWVADWTRTNQDKYYITYDAKVKHYYGFSHTHHNDLSKVYMSQANADKLCKLLNDGIVEF